MKRLIRVHDSGMEGEDSHDRASQVPRQHKVPEARARGLLILPTTPPTTKDPTRYPQHLTPTPSHLCPHCLAKDQLRCWSPASHMPILVGSSVTSEAECERMMEIMLHAWEENTHVSYSAGLLMWHCFCNKKGTSEEARAPAMQALLSMFVAHLATAYSGRTITRYLSGVRVWHVLHGLPWVLKNCKMDTMLQAANKLTPSALKKKKRCPYTPDFILAVCSHLDLDKPLDAACSLA